MKTRMQPIGVVWNKLPRVVRDLARPPAANKSSCVRLLNHIEKSAVKPTKSGSTAI
jgi:hypothetical protein